MTSDQYLNINTEQWGNRGAYLKHAEVANPDRDPRHEPIIREGVELKLLSKGQGVELLITDYDSTAELRVKLTREVINTMIRKLRDARNSVFGEDQ